MRNRCLLIAFTIPALPLVMSCKSEAARRCQQQFQNAQVIVQEKSSQTEGLETSIAAVDDALIACRAADRQHEVRELQTARNSLASHQQAMRQRSNIPKHAKATPAELDDLVKRGDPECPRGMAYNIEGTNRSVRCTGLQPVRMSWSKVVDYYSKHGYHVTKTVTPPIVRAERGAELNVFAFSKPEDTAAVKCLTVYPEPAVSWQEAVSRVTGAPLNKIKLGSSVPLADGKVALHVEQGKDKLVVHLGECD